MPSRWRTPWITTGSSTLTLNGLLARMWRTDVEVFSHKTVNGHAVIVSRGFDTRDLVSYWNDPEEVSLKRDAKLLWTWAQTPES